MPTTDRTAYRSRDEWRPADSVDGYPRGDDRMKHPLSDEEYCPDDELASELKALTEEAELTDESEHSVELFGLEIGKKTYTAMIEDSQIEGYETITPATIMMSLKGDLGFASAYALASATEFGNITLVYLDEISSPSPNGEPYQDLTVEWYKSGDDNGDLSDARLNNRAVNADAQVIEVEQLEDWARRWISNHRK